MRLFAAIRPPAPVLDHLSAALALALDPRADRSSPLSPRSNWHVTLAFYGDLPDAAGSPLATALNEALGDAEPFTLELRGAGRFRGRVGWIGVGGETTALAAASRGAADALSDAGLDWRGRDHRARAKLEAHRPHLTVTRAADRPVTAHALQALAVYTGPSWLVEEVELVQSELGAGPGGHARHSILATVPLAATVRPREGSIESLSSDGAEQP